MEAFAAQEESLKQAEQEAAARRERERTQATQVRAVVAPVGYRRQRGLLDSGPACHWGAPLRPRAFL